MIRSFIIILILLFIPFAFAQTPVSGVQLAEEQEQLARDIGRDLRCVVCQAQTIEDSDADFAIDMRRKVREMIAEGKSRAEIEQYMQARYGDYILMNPRMSSGNALLWFGPFLILALLLVWFVSSRRKAIKP